MSEQWEIDPKNPDGDGAGAEGGAVGGDSAGDTTLPPPLQPSQDVDRTNPFEPTGGTSTPYPSDNIEEDIELTNMALDERNFDRLLTKFMGGEDKRKALDKTLRLIKDKYRKS